MTRTEGRRLLATALAQKGRSQSWLARQLGISQHSVWLWLNGVSRPEPTRRLRLQELLGVPAGSWMTTPERKAALPHPDRSSEAA